MARDEEIQVADFAETSVGEEFFTGSYVISRGDLVAYANASGDQNPIHQDEEFAKSVGLPDVIAHGMFTMGLVGSAIEDCVGAGNVIEYAAKFAAPIVVPADGGADIDIQLKLVSRDEDARTAVVDATVTASGTKVLGRTRATVRLQ